MLDYAMWCFFAAITVGLLGLTGLLNGGLRASKFLFVSFAVLLVVSFVG